MVRAQLRLHARFITSEPPRQHSELGISDVTVQVNKLTINTGTQMAYYGGWSTATKMSFNSAELTYHAELDLEPASIYQVRYRAVNEFNEIRSKVSFIDTQDTGTYRRIDMRVWEDNTNIGLSGVNLILTPPSSFQFNRYLPGLRDSGSVFTEVEIPQEGIELYDYAIRKETGVTFQKQSNAFGWAEFQRLPNGTYSLQLSKAGYQTRTITVTINNADVQGLFVDLTKLT
jgi:hypothetical protein